MAAANAETRVPGHGVHKQLTWQPVRCLPYMVVNFGMPYRRGLRGSWTQYLVSSSRAGARAHCAALEVVLHPDSGTGVSAFCPSAQAEGGPHNLVVGVHRCQNPQPTCRSPDIVSSQCREETQTEEPAGVARGTLTSKPSVGCRIVPKVARWWFMLAVPEGWSTETFLAPAEKMSPTGLEGRWP